MRLEIRPIRENEVSEALLIHQQAWPNGHAEVIDEKTIHHQVRHNGHYQIGAFLADDAEKSRMLAVVTTARFRVGKTGRTKQALKKDGLPHYNALRQMAVKDGNALACFIISSPVKLSSEEQNAIGSGQIAGKIIHEVKKRAQFDSRITHVLAASTPKDINRHLGLSQGGTPKNMKQVLAYLRLKKDAVIHRFHQRLGASVWKVALKKRPNSPNLPGAGVLVWMRYRTSRKTAAKVRGRGLDLQT
ncbi:MAG: hypothetical protein Q8P02_05240 [Candidatus Micrarchaeota archaeon]|nr:hypothetical protein [Candidatus Micrarchaeota archaeon]